ncbi:hypothetical protein [Ectothiorhodospira lacustris]|uniref:hypothetical protein n=1 Tax=Ectothiorhodospira lacustris TaxID=2899127 RepID=UPI001EE897D1|nr:hypothetical protein [Ectothiorhodospira lacustris]MCG5501304.1 hypothetical protein [Ectothiorhodospira lacustris]
MSVVLTALTVLGGFAMLGFLLDKCYFLAPTRLGWLFYYPSVVYETIEKRLGIARPLQDASYLLIGVGSLWLGWNAGFAVVMAVAAGLAWAWALYTDLCWRADVPAQQHSGLSRAPFPVPRLILRIQGPVLERGASSYRLGAWPVGLRQRFSLFILNPTAVHPQVGMDVLIESGTESVIVHADLAAVNSAPAPGGLIEIPFELEAVAASTRQVNVKVRAVHADFNWERTLNLDCIPAADSISIASANINRWKWGSSAAFCWRGDHDLQDPATFQSTEGLRKALGLAARYYFPTTVMLSARLSLVEGEHRAFCEHFGWDRKSEDIPEFIEFLKQEVDTRSEQEFPTANNRPFSAEIGNHQYLHYKTHAAAAAGNDWKSHACPGDGKYDWMKQYPCSSFEEQRDNMLKCAEVMEETIGVRPSSFTIPSDYWDSDTARAVEAAGIEVSNDTDTKKLHKLLFFPREHHPKGCERLVEITRVLPKDPATAAHVAQLKFWLAFARRNRRAMTFLAHHHLLMYQGNACYNLTGELLRHVLADTEGDVWCGTLTSIGRYWRDVLSDKTRCITIYKDTSSVIVRNDGARELVALPLVIELQGGCKLMRIVTIPAYGETRITLS